MSYKVENKLDEPLDKDKRIYKQIILANAQDHVLLVEYTPITPGQGVYKPEKMTKFFKLVYPLTPL